MQPVIQPVCFGGVDWQSRRKLGMDLRPTPLEVARRRLPQLQEAVKGVQWRDLLEVNAPAEIPTLVEAARDCDLVLALASELLVVQTAARALESVPAPVAITGAENCPGPFFADVYGCLKADERDVYLALDAADVQQLVIALGAQKRLESTRALLIGEGWPSFSQVANPASPRVVEDALGVEVVERSIDHLRALYESTDDERSRDVADAWLDGAAEVDESARRDIVECARLYLAMDALLAETGANALTVNCRAWDLLSCEEFGAFYSPCMGLTHLRWRGIPAACEADICALFAMCVLTYVSGKPGFLGNIGAVDRERSSVAIGGHAACTVDMDGAGGDLAGYRLTDYGGRGGVASYLAIEEGRPVTIARFDRTMRRISVAIGHTVETDRCFEVALGDVEDFMHRCLAGDHYIVVYGHHLEAIAILAERMGLEILTPNEVRGMR